VQACNPHWWETPRAFSVLKNGAVFLLRGCAHRYHSGRPKSHRTKGARPSPAMKLVFIDEVEQPHKAPGFFGIGALMVTSTLEPAQLLLSSGSPEVGRRPPCSGASVMSGIWDLLCEAAELGEGLSFSHNVADTSAPPSELRPSCSLSA